MQEVERMYSLDDVKKTDPEIAQAIVDEQERQNSHIELIASENWVSKAVMATMGSVLTNKYAEGYPAKRYYGGCDCVDVVENLAIERAKELFGCDYANVQPHSGAQANMAVQFAVLNPGDTIMGMNLDHRGPRGGMILCNKEAAEKYNFNKAIFPGTQGGPLMHVIAAKAVCFKEALSDDFKVYQQGIIDNAQALCHGLMERGIKIVSGGTDNHLMLVDLTNFDLTGKAVEKLLDAAHITCNKNTIPNDPKSPFVTSGVRLGTPAVTSRGMNTEDMDRIAEAIALVIKGGEDKIPEARAIVQTLTDKYPLI